MFSATQKNTILNPNSLFRKCIVGNKQMKSLAKRLLLLLFEQIKHEDEHPYLKIADV